MPDSSSTVIDRPIGASYGSAYGANLGLLI